MLTVALISKHVNVSCNNDNIHNLSVFFYIDPKENTAVNGDVRKLPLNATPLLAPLLPSLKRLNKPFESLPYMDPKLNHTHSQKEIQYF